MRRNAGLILVWFFALLFGIPAFALWYFYGSPPPRQPTVGDYRQAARHYCADTISGMLHNPRSADWGRRSEWPVTIHGEEGASALAAENTWRVVVRVRAQNAFGATVINHYTCDLRNNGGLGGWRLLSLS